MFLYLIKEDKERTMEARKKDILEYIESQQEGTSGIYPYYVAIDVMARFNIPYNEARECVQEHIKVVVDSL